MHLYQAYLEAAGLPPMDHRNRRVSGSHKGADPEAVRRAQEKIDFPFESITEVKTVTGGELARTVRVTGGTTGSVANDNEAQTAA